MSGDLPELPEGAFEKEDTSPDPLFYASPRFVTHIDDQAIAAVTSLYRQVFPAGGTILDLMGSWVSHLPAEVSYGEVIGHGMNEEELKANPRYTRWFARDLNADPTLPLDDESIDAASICVSVQYLQQPVAVFRELKRVLKPKGVVAISFSNRCFPTKAMAIWLNLPMGQHQRLIGLYLQRAGFDSAEALTLIPPGQQQDPLWAVLGHR
jgi:SAM-dependent methyltransferase